MYLLKLCQNMRVIDLAVFNTLEEGRAFLSKLDAYELEIEAGVEFEYLDPGKLGDYNEINFNGHIIPLTKYMFDNTEKAEIIWLPVSNLSIKGNGVIDGSTRVDAYHINNFDLKNYIKNREKNYKMVKNYLEEKGYEVSRSYYGSEDGEAILYRKIDEGEWSFLTHMDPIFSEDKDILATIKESI